MIIPDTINFHLLYHCNADCLYCYRPSGNELSHEQRCRIIDMIAAAPPRPDGRPRRVNFAGGEPTLIRQLPALLRHAKARGLETSIITNGTALLKKGIGAYRDYVDMIGLSIDSASDRTNRDIGRPVIATDQWTALADQIRVAGIALKINTVVCRQNHAEDLTHFIAAMRPDRWKILRAIAINGVNDGADAAWSVSDEQFKAFVARHTGLGAAGLAPVVEDEADLRGSYAMIQPDGCFYDSVDGGYFASDPILSVGLAAAFTQVRFSASKFVKRGGRFVLPVLGEVSDES